MDSHEYAGKLRAAAEFLESRSPFEIGINGDLYLSYYNKEQFIAAVRAVGSGEKRLTDNYYEFRPSGAPHIQIYAGREVVCRKIQDVKYECEPLLSDDEAAALGTETVPSGA